MQLSHVGNEVSKVFNRLKNILPDTIILKTHTVRKVAPINENSTLGEQIKHYRRLADIEQTELGSRLGCSHYRIRHIENDEVKLVDINLLIAVIEELGIRDKININDDYLEFLMDNPSEAIINFRKARNLTRKELADMMGVFATSIRDWEIGEAIISRAKFEQLKRCMS